MEVESGVEKLWTKKEEGKDKLRGFVREGEEGG